MTGTLKRVLVRPPLSEDVERWREYGWRAAPDHPERKECPSAPERVTDRLVSVSRFLEEADCREEVATRCRYEPAASYRQRQNPRTTESRCRRLPVGDQKGGFFDPTALQQRLDVFGAPPPQVRVIPSADVGRVLGFNEYRPRGCRVSAPEIADPQNGDVLGQQVPIGQRQRAS